MKGCVLIGTVIGMAALIALGSCSDELGNKLSGFDTDNPAQSVNDILTGKAYLDYQTDHSFIRVDLPDAGFSMLTNEEGTFELPKDLSEGDWTIRAQYPYYHTVTETFSVSRGVPEKQLTDMDLERAVKFTLTTNGSYFKRGSTVIMTLAAENDSEKEIILSSTTSPMAAYSVRYNGTVVAGGLYPGDEDEPQTLTLEPGDTRYFELRWKIEDPNLISGDYEIFAVLTTNGTHPEYFDDSEDASTKFNDSLYEKLRPTEIRID
jgi:hypothetical protein